MLLDVIRRLELCKCKKIGMINNNNDIEFFKKLNYEIIKANKKYDCIVSFIYNIEEFRILIKKLVDDYNLEDKAKLYVCYQTNAYNEYNESVSKEDVFKYLNINVNNTADKKNAFSYLNIFRLDHNYSLMILEYDIKHVNYSKNDDKLEYIKMFKEKLDEESLALYNDLSLSFQEEWVEYVYGAQNQEGIEKRIIEAMKILKMGYKSKALYSENLN